MGFRCARRDGTRSTPHSENYYVYRGILYTVQIDCPEMLQDQQHNCLVTLILRERNKSILYTYIGTLS